MKRLQQKYRFSSWLYVPCAVALLAASSADAGDALIEGGRLCTQQFPVQEQKYRIPTHLLAAISTTESGRWHKGLGMAVPWPWTINVEGKGYVFDTKAEAIARTQQFMEQGYRSIDVGCMQVNLKHHAKAFRSLEQAFDPEANVAYAARFLRDNYADLGDWIKATAAYHSRTQVHGQRYLAQIERSWNSIVAKVTAARATQAKGGVPPASNPAPAQSAADDTHTPIPQGESRERKPKPLVVRAVSTSRTERLIKVSDAPRPSGSEILVVRGSTSTRESVPDGTAASFQPTGDSVRRVTLDNGGVGTQPEGSGNSKFVFAN